MLILNLGRSSPIGFLKRSFSGRSSKSDITQNDTFSPPTAPPHAAYGPQAPLGATRDVMKLPDTSPFSVPIDAELQQYVSQQRQELASPPRQQPMSEFGVEEKN